MPFLSAAKSVSGTTPPTGAPRAIAHAAPRSSTSHTPAVVQRQAAAVPRAPEAPGSTPGIAGTNATTTAPAPSPRPDRAPTPVQRVPVQRDAGGPPLPTPATTTTAVSTVTAHGTSSRGPLAADSTSEPHKTPKTSKTLDEDEPLPEYIAVPEGKFDPRSLTDFQLDELTHRLIGRITRLIRTELRLDRERIGKLRDPRR